MNYTFKQLVNDLKIGHVIEFYYKQAIYGIVHSHSI